MNTNEPSYPQSSQQPEGQPYPSAPQQPYVPQPPTQQQYPPVQQQYPPSQQQYPPSQQYQQPMSQQPFTGQSPYTGQPPTFVTPPPLNRSNILIISLSIVGGLVILALLAVLIINHSPNSHTSAVIAPTIVPTTTFTPSATCLGPGDKTPVGDNWSMQLVNAIPLTLTNGPGLEVDLSVENLTDSSQILSTSQLYLISPAGQRNVDAPQQFSFDAHQIQQISPQFDIAPGEHLFSFEVVLGSQTGACWSFDTNG